MTTPSSSVLPRRGGNHYSYGVFLGGSALNIDYKLVGPSTLFYKSINQTRGLKVVTASEGAINKRRNDVTNLKFNGKLDTDAAASTTELNKTAFEFELTRMINNLGLQTFFYVPDADFKGMVYLVDHSHKLTVQDVIEEHKSRMNEPAPIYLVDSSGNPTGVETEDSKKERFRCYDQYKLTDIQLSRAMVDSLVSPSLRLQVLTRFRHDVEFDNYAGSVYLMMIYEVVNASTSLDIAQATSTFEMLSLDKYPPENVSTFLDESLRLIHIMDCAYALPYQLGSQLLEKLDSTSSNYFNMQVQQMLFEARTMEESVGPVADPKSLTLHKSYSEYGPVALCGSLQTLYSGLLKSKSWPALSATIPEGNNATHSTFQTVVDDTNNVVPSNSARGSNGNPNNPTRSPIMLPPKIWKYLEPANSDQTIEVNGIIYYWCGKCYCRNTGNRGLYNLTHPTSQHQRRINPQSARATTTNNHTRTNDTDNPTTTAANLSSVPTSSTTSSNLEPEPSNLKAGTKTIKFADQVEDDDKVDDDPHGFQFNGAFLNATDQDQLWLSAVDDTDDEHNEPLPPPVLLSGPTSVTQPIFGPLLPPNFVRHSAPAPSMMPSTAPTATARETNTDVDPFATAAIRLSLSAMANEMHQDGFAVDTLLQMEEPIEEPAVTEPTIGPHFPPAQVPFPSVTSTDPTDRVRLACIALANAAEPRNEDWPSNVVSALPGLTLYSINDAPHLIFNDIHAPAHCEYCGRMGDWLCYCRCGRGLHTMSDDGYYSEGQLDIHFDSDVDTAEFLETDHETDDDSTNEGDSVVSVNENNSSTTCYSQSLSSSHYFIWCFLLSLILTSKAFLTSCYSIGQSSLHSFWSYTSFWFLLFAVLFWDTLYLYFDPKAPQGPYQPCSVRRKLTKQKHLPLRSYTK